MIIHLWSHLSMLTLPIIFNITLLYKFIFYHIHLLNSRPIRYICKIHVLNIPHRTMHSVNSVVIYACVVVGWVCMRKDKFGEHSTERVDEIGGYLINQARKSAHGMEELEKAKVSSTVYIGNLSFYTTEEQVYELLSKAGPIRRVIMGLDRFNKTPCGFCFVEYVSHDDSLRSIRYLNGTKLDDRIIQIDRDPGFTEGRQFGRGAGGGQKRDEYRQDFDAGRGGYGGLARDQEN